MNRKIVWLVTVLLFTSIRLAEAQQTKIHRIGFLSGGFIGPAHWTRRLRQEFREVAMLRGKMVVESRFTENNLDRLPFMANAGADGYYGKSTESRGKRRVWVFEPLSSPDEKPKLAARL